MYIFFSGLVVVVMARLLFRKVLDFPGYSGKLLTGHSEAEHLMCEDEFWQIIKQTKSESKSNYRLQCRLLTQYLGGMSEDDIVKFDRTFHFLMAGSYRFRLWESAYALNGGCSDDTFEYFRSWLIAQGKNKFYWTVRYPRLLFFAGVKELIENYEGITYCADEAYRRKTGHDKPFPRDIPYPDAGKMFTEATAFLRYPELALFAW